MSDETSSVHRRAPIRAVIDTSTLVHAQLRRRLQQQAEYVISENTRDFPPPDRTGMHAWEGIEYIEGWKFLDSLIPVSEETT